MELNKIYTEDCRVTLKRMEPESINCCVTSPPYYGLRDYGHADQIGLEETPEAYVQNLVEVFREVRRVLRKDGTMFLNLGDSYWVGKGASSQAWSTSMVGKRETINGQQCQIATKGETRPTDRKHEIIKPKDLIGIPWMVAFALRADGWYLRQDIIWCLSGGSMVYAKTQKGEMPMTVRDISRLNPKTVKLWNGQKWTQVLGISHNKRRGDEIELVLRSGERISCTPTHRFPTNRGVIEGREIHQGDVLESCTLPEPETTKGCAIDADAAWLAGLYIAEGSISEDTIQIAGHAKEVERWDRVQNIARKFGGTATITTYGNNQSIRIYGKVLNAIIQELVSGDCAGNKGFSSKVWQYSNNFIQSMLNGYLSGDGHWDAANNRWRLGFTRNYNLERDLRTACARLGYKITLNMSSVKYNEHNRPVFRGEIRMERSGHHNERNQNEVVEIRRARCRNVYDLGVEDDPHLFSLASGILTHNSKPNPMPESVTDRCTKAHEYIFLLSKSARYYYDAEAVKEKSADSTKERGKYGWYGNVQIDNDGKERRAQPDLTDKMGDRWCADLANKRSVWTVTTKPFKEAHFATFPEQLIEPCVLAGCPEKGIIYDPFMGAATTALVALRGNRQFIGSELNPEYVKIGMKRILPLLKQHQLF